MTGQDQCRRLPLLSLALAIGVGLVTSANAQTGSGERGEAWTNGGGSVWLNEDGECWYNPDMPKSKALEACGDVMKTAEPEPEPEPEPAPEPQTEPEPQPRQVERTERRNIGSEALFGFDEASLSDRARARLAQMVDDIAADWELERIRVLGYTDRIGPESYNQSLSEDRAQAVADYLANQPELGDYELEVVGRGEADPVVQCQGTGSRDALIKCLRPNRRVEVELKGMKTIEPAQ